MFDYGFPKDWSTLKKLAFLRGSGLGGGGSYITLVGDIVRFMASRSAPFRKLQIALEPIQDLHGYDDPWPAGGGVNKLEPYAIPDGTKYGVEYSNNEDGSIKASGEVEVRSWNFMSATYPLSKYGLSPGTAISLLISGADTQFVARFYNGATLLGGIIIAKNTAQTIGTAIASGEVPADATSIEFLVYCQASTFPDVGDTFDKTVYPMLAVGSTAPTAWTPYSNICPISGRTSATVTRTGKNLLPTEAQAVSNWHAGDASSGGYKYYRCNLPSGTYYVHSPHTVPFNNTLYMRTVIYKADGTYTREYMYHATDTSENRDIDPVVIPQGGYLQLEEYGNDGNAFVNNLWITKSAEAPYEPYAGTTYTIQLGDTVYGGTLDVVNGTLTVDRIHAAFLATGKQDNFMYTTLSAQSLPGIKGLNAGVVCNRYPVFPNVAASEIDPKITMYANGIIRWIEPDYIDKTYQEFNDMMGNNKVEVVYELATPIEITLTPQAINSLVGENNVWDDGTVTVEVKGEAIT